MTERTDVSHIFIKVEGTSMPPEMLGDLLEVTVDLSLHLPSMFTFRLYNHDMKWLEDETLNVGKKVEIFYGEQPPLKLMSGKIASLEPDLDANAPALVVRGYDVSHRLYRGRRRRTFNQVTDAEIVRQLATESGLRPGEIQSTPEKHEHVYQHNQTDAEFLLARARRIGFLLWVEDEMLHFRKPRAEGEAVRLAWGSQLRSFRPRLSTAEQVSEVEVRGWDPTKKQEVVGRATRGEGEPQIGISQPGAQVAEQAWGQAKYAIVDQFVRSPSEAEALAQAALDEMASAFVEAEGTCDASPEIIPGKQVQVEAVGSRFNGTYYVTEVVHSWNKDSAMLTHFSVSGRRDRGIWSLLQEPRQEPPGLGLVIGVVTRNKDPEEMGRVRVKFPWLSDSDESAWARVVAPMAGKGRGFMYFPEIDDEVLVGFEHGDIHRPFVIGALWNGTDYPPLNAAEAVGGDGLVNKRIVKSRSGHTVTLDDTDGAEEITIVDKTGNNKIVFHSPDNSMQIRVDGDLTIEALGKITLKAGSTVELNSQADFKISGQSGVDVASQAQLKLAGQAGAELSSAAQTVVKGSLIDVSGTGPVTVAGTPIKLN